MTIIVSIGDTGETAEFPDGTTDEVIESALDKFRIESATGNETEDETKSEPFLKEALEKHKKVTKGLKEALNAFIDPFNPKNVKRVNTAFDKVNSFQKSLRSKKKEESKEKDSKGKIMKTPEGMPPKSLRFLEAMTTVTSPHVSRSITKLINSDKKQTLERKTRSLAEIIPFVAAPELKGGVSTLKGVSKLIFSSGKVGGVIGSARAVEEIAKGESPGKAAAEAGLAAIKGALLAAGVKTTINTVSVAAKGVFGRLSQVRNNAVQEAIKDPSIIKNEQEPLIDVARETIETVDDFARKQSETFEASLSRIKAPKGNIINARAARDALIERGVSPIKLKPQIMAVVNSEASDISENTVDRFLAGGNLSYNEARQVNSMLRQVSGSGLPEIGSGLKGKVSSSKSLLLEEIEKKVPGTKSLNKIFAVGVEKVKRIKSVLGKNAEEAQKKEGVFRAIGEQETGIRRNRTAIIREIKDLDNEMGTSLLKQIKDSTVSEAFEKVSMDNLLGTARIGGGGALGATLLASGGPALAGAGALVGGLGAQALSSPQATRSAVLAGTALAPKLAGAQKFVAPSLNEIIFGNSQGN